MGEGAAVPRGGRKAGTPVTLLAVAVAGRGLVDPREPVFFADDEAVVRGTAAFETLRIRGGAPVLLDRHVERLERSSLALRLPPPDGARPPCTPAGKQVPPRRGTMYIHAPCIRRTASHARRLSKPRP